MKNIIAQITSEKQKVLAEQLLSKNAPVSSSQVYIRGFATASDIKHLREEGLLVEELPTEFSAATSTGLEWLEPRINSAEDLSLLASKGGAQMTPEMRRMQEDAPVICIIQLKGPIRTEWKTRLSKIKVKIISAKPNFGLKVSLPNTSCEALQDLEFVARVVRADVATRQQQIREDIETAKRLQQDMVNRQYMDSEQAKTVQRFELKTQTPEQLQIVANLLRNDERVNNLQQGQTRLRFDCDEKSPLLDELAHMSNVISWIQPFIPPVLTNSYVRSALGVVRDTPPKALPWDGTGEIIGVADSGVDSEHPDLKPAIKKVITWEKSSSPDDPVGHGTHVCGTIAGRGVASKQLIGVAPGAQLVVQSICDDAGRPTGLPIDLGSLFQEAYDEGARIHSNSWGFIVDGRYSADSLEVDQFVYDHPDFLVVMAAGNEGRQRNEAPVGAIDYRSLRAPGSAKNVLTVGACCSSRNDGPNAGKLWNQYSPPFAIATIATDKVTGELKNIAAFSSRGPSDDERIKPEVVAPGTDILSTRSNGCTLGPIWQKNIHYMFLSGTSMAAPAVAGAAAIVRQYYREELNHSPSAALLKATLIGAAKWSSYEGGKDPLVGQPNYHQGFGRVDLTAVIPTRGGASGLKLLFKDVNRTDPEALNKGDSQHGKWEAQFFVKSDMPLIVTLVWTDRAAHGLQQDLDLQIKDPNGRMYIGNSGLVKPSWAMGDRKNNVEQITIENPLEGLYRVFIVAYNTPFEHQGFSVVAGGQITSDWLP